MTSRTLRQFFNALLMVSGLLGSSTATALELAYGGRLSAANGAPVEGAVDLTFRFFSVVSGGTQLGEISISNVTLVDGMFQVVLNLSSSQVQDIFQGGNTPVFIETVQGDQVYPRQRFSFVPYALRVPIDEDKLRYVDGKLTLSPQVLEHSSAVTSVNLSAPAAGLTVSGGPITTSGSIAIGLANDLAALEALSTVGVVERTGPDTWGTFGITPAGKDFLIANDASSQRSKLGLGDLSTRSSLTSTDVIEGTNLYFTTRRARDALSATPPLLYATNSGVFSIGQASGTASGYLSAADFLTFTNKQGAISPTSTLHTASLTTASQSGLELKPDSMLTNQTGELRFDELAANGANYVGFKAPSIISLNRVWTLPSSDGTAGQVLTTNGAGILSWGTVSGGGGGGGSVTSVNLTPPAAGITVEGGPIINSGSININLANDLAAVEGLTEIGGVERTGSETWATYPLTSAGKALLDDADHAAQRTTLGLGLLATLDTVTGAQITNGSVTNDDISATAEIAQSKIANLSSDLAAKEPSIAAGANSQYFRGDKTWQTLNTSAVTEGTNLYYTDSRARLASSATAPLSYNSSTGVMSIPQASTGANGFLSSADFTSFNNKQAAITSASVVNAGTVTSALQNGFELNPYGSTAGNTGELRFEELTAYGNNFVGFKAPDSLSGNVIWTLPSVVGSSGQVLSAGAGGVLSWITIPSAPITSVAGRTGAVTLANTDISGLGSLATVSAVSGGSSGTITDGTVTNDDISNTAAIADTKLATIASAGKVANSATTATNANTAGTIVARDASGNFSAGTITATLNGNASNVTGTVALTNGGTGANLSSTGGAGQYLKQSTVGGPVTVGIIASGDVPWASPGAIGATTANSAAFTTLTSSGNVGIGTMSPTSPLQVNGTIHTMAGGIKFPNNTVQTTAAKVLTYSGTFNGVSQVDIEEPFGKGHKSLEIKFMTVTFSVDGGTPEVRIKNGGAYQTGAFYDWHYVFTRWGWGPGRFGQQSDTKIGIMTETATPSDRVGNALGENFKAKFDISWPDVSSNQKIISWDAFWHCADAAKVLCDSRGQGIYTGNTNAVEGFRLFVSAGTISGSWLVTAYD